MIVNRLFFCYSIFSPMIRWVNMNIGILAIWGILYQINLTSASTGKFIHVFISKLTLNTVVFMLSCPLCLLSSYWNLHYFISIRDEMLIWRIAVFNWFWKLNKLSLWLFILRSESLCETVSQVWSSINCVTARGL